MAPHATERGGWRGQGGGAAEVDLAPGSVGEVAGGVVAQGARRREGRPRRGRRCASGARADDGRARRGARGWRAARLERRQAATRARSTGERREHVDGADASRSPRNTPDPPRRSRGDGALELHLRLARLGLATPAPRAGDVRPRPTGSRAAPGGAPFRANRLPAKLGAGPVRPRTRSSPDRPPARNRSARRPEGRPPAATPRRRSSRASSGAHNSGVAMARYGPPDILRATIAFLDRPWILANFAYRARGLSRRTIDTPAVRGRNRGRTGGSRLALG